MAEQRRTMDKAWKWLFFGLLAFYLLSLFVEWIHLDFPVLLIIILLLFLILWRLFRADPPVDFTTCLDDISKVQFRHNGVTLPVNPRNAEIIPDGPRWIAFFWKTSDNDTPVAYRYDPETRAVVGREINDHEAILKRLQENDVLRDLVKETQRKKQERAAALKHGLEPDELDDGETL